MRSAVTPGADGRLLALPVRGRTELWREGSKGIESKAPIRAFFGAGVSFLLPNMRLSGLPRGEIGAFGKDVRRLGDEVQRNEAN